MRAVVGAGSNLGDRIAILERAAQRLAAIAKTKVRSSPVYTTPALLPENGPDEWRIPFLNCVFEFEWSADAHSLFRTLKEIENELGRVPAARWAPRLIDLDLLTFGNAKIADTDLVVPHRELRKRSFVLDPLKDLEPARFQAARRLPSHAPGWMAIVNVTPDSFSDGGKFVSEEHLREYLRSVLENQPQVLDIGAESTRPGAVSLTESQELARLEPLFRIVREEWGGRIVKPFLSLDTRHAEVARKALENGFDWINDVSGLADFRILEPVRSANATYILMHSLSVPANPAIHIADDLDVVGEVKRWATEKIETIRGAGIALEKIVFDPGIGFGKTAQQSITLLKRIDEFRDLPVRLLVGHSRKGFLKTWTQASAENRDPETLGVSLRLATRGVDYIRVHDAAAHQRAYHAYREVAD